MQLTIPSPIVDLHLIHAFKGYTISIDQCIKSEQKEVLYLADIEKKCYSDFVTPSAIEYKSGKILTIVNNNRNEIVLIQIDNKLISSSSSQPRCDCAIVNNTDFHFIEFKTNALAHSEKAYSQTYETAMNQLSASAHLFIEKTNRIGVILREKRKLSAHICTTARFPRIQSSELGYAVRFGILEKIPLYFDNTIYM